MPISVFSEIGPLRCVLLHRPGRELKELSNEQIAKHFDT